jgi:integrase
VHPKAMQKIMGHSDIGMTMKYAHFAKEDLANAMLLLEDELGMTVTECNKSATNNTLTLN